MFARYVRQTIGRNMALSPLRFYSTKKGSNPITPKETKLSEAEEIKVLNIDTSSTEFKELIKNSKKQYTSILQKLGQSLEEGEGKKSAQALYVKPKIHISTPSGKFAHSLFTTASQLRSLGMVAREVEMIKEGLTAVPDLRTVLEGDVDTNEKILAMDLFSQVFTNLSPLTTYYLYYMTYEKQFANLYQSLVDFKRLIDSLSTELSVKLTVVTEQSDKQKQEMESLIKSYFPTDTVFKFSYAVDPSIQAGYIIESPLLNHNASLKHAVESVESEERSIFADLVSDVKKSMRNNEEFWNSKELKDKYFKFDLKEYEERLKKENN